MIYLLQHILDRSAERSPEATAFRFGNDDLSYAELARRSDALAEGLVRAGVKPGDRVGIHLRKSLRIAEALFGILKSGAAFVPLDPALPASRLDAIIRSAGIRHVVTGDAMPTALDTATEGGRRLDLIVGPSDYAEYVQILPWAELDGLTSPARPDCRVMEDDMAYLMFTSGSTGIPKGIIHTHASGLSFASTAAEVYGLRSDDRLSGFPPLHFDQSIFDFFSGPFAGATTVIIPEAHMMLPASLSSLIQRERLTVWYSVPYALVQLLERGLIAERDLSSLRWVLFGGEVFPVQHLRRLMELLPSARFSNVYGPAEVNQCTFHHLSAPTDCPDAPATLPLGRVWPNAEALVLGDDDQIVHDGEEGEFVVRTPTMMKGYWDEPDQSSTFYHRSREGGRKDVFYRTGDIVRKGKDGLYHFLGRRDRQVKSRGFRIELDEIEAACLAHPGVSEAAAYSAGGDKGSKRICLAVRPAMPTSLSEGELRSFLARALPPYAIPADIRFVVKFPRTTSGKIDHRSLEYHDWSRA